MPLHLRSFLLQHCSKVLCNIVSSDDAVVCLKIGDNYFLIMNFSFVTLVSASKRTYVIRILKLYSIFSCNWNATQFVFYYCINLCKYAILIIDLFKIELQTVHDTLCIILSSFCLFYVQRQCIHIRYRVG